jgi:hypothetical protein
MGLPALRYARLAPVAQSAALRANGAVLNDKAKASTIRIDQAVTLNRMFHSFLMPRLPRGLLHADRPTLSASLAQAGRATYKAHSPARYLAARLR